MFKNIFKFRPKKFLGIDIGTSYIKIVEISRKGKNFKLENYGELGILYPRGKPFRVFEQDTLLLSNQDIAQTIQIICQEAKIQTKDVIFSIPDFSSFFTTFKLPEMTEEEIPQAIRYEVRPYIPLPLSEISIDWLITEGEVGRTPLKVLVVAIPNDIISQYQEIANISKLNLKTLEPEVFALIRSLSFLIRGDDKKITALVDIGARTTTCSILEQEILKISHSFNIGSNELTEILARSLNIDYNKAEELKRKHGLILGGSAFGKTRQTIREILLPLVDAILDETKKIFRNFYQTEGKEIEKIILAGGLALLPGLKEYFYNEIKKEIVIANPFLNLSCPPILAEILQKSGPSYAVAVGLALKGLE